MRRDETIVIGELNGRNGADPPLSLPNDQAVEMQNVDRFDGMIGRKRGGSDAVSTTGGSSFSGGIQTLMRHVPGASEAAAELWGVDATGGGTSPLIKRLTGGTTWADAPVDDSLPAGSGPDVVGATLNGKLFLAYDSSTDRLHAYDPSLSIPRVRRVGIAPGSNAPTVADTGAGAYAATLRYYRVRFLQIDAATVTVRKSEATPAVSFTPSGGGSAARITRPTAPGEGETHWGVDVSLDNTTWNVLVGTGGAFSFIVIATTTADDNVATTQYATLPFADTAGFYGLFPSVKSLITDGNRLLGAGAWESAGTTSGGKNSRIWFTPVLGSADKSDDERVPNTTTQKNYLDLNENDGGGIVGLGGPLNGVPFAFKYRQVWRLHPTGDVNVPYLPKKIVDGVGAVNHKCITVGEDEAGRPCLYWLSFDGAYRYGANGLQYLWRDNEDITINLGASTVVAHSLFFHEKHQWWLWIATGSSNDPDTLMVFDVLLGELDGRGCVRKGWFKFTGNLAGARCSVMFANTLGASMSRDSKPYIGRSTGTAIHKGDTATTDDAGTAFQAYVKTKPLPVAPLGHNAGLQDAQLLAEVGSATITLTLDRDYGLETRTSTVSLAASASETRKLAKFEASAMAGAGTIQAQIGDGSAVASTWVLDALVLPVTTQERR